jgi:hypothetical protein
MVYEIRSIAAAGGNDEFEIERKHKRIAFSTAKQISKRDKVYEVVMFEYTGGSFPDYDGDFTGQWYFRNGRLTHTMGGNN